MMEQTAWSRVRTAATLVARLVLGAVFALAALAKITAPGLFRQDVAAYHLLPPAVVGPFALALPWFEALLALYLLVGLFLRPTAVATAALLLVFTGALAISLARGATAHGCGCLPTSGPLGSLPLVAWLAGGATISAFDVVRDLVFVALTAAIYWGDRDTLSLDGLLFRAAPGYRPDDEDAELARTPAAVATAHRQGKDKDIGMPPRRST
jgi:uncharacterized membrane protein YphA (DoxX/SURF4 family)